MVMVPEKVLKRRLTYEDYQSLPDDQDYEIIDGVLYVAPRARPLHQIVVYRLAGIIDVHAKQQNLGVPIPDTDLIVKERDIYVSPDIMFFRADRFATLNRDEEIRIIPDLIVEVLSPISEDYDRQTKKRTYAQLGVQHYWIVDPRKQAITECVLQPDGEYRERVTGSDDNFRPAVFPELQIEPAKLFE